MGHVVDRVRATVWALHVAAGNLDDELAAVAEDVAAAESASAELSFAVAPPTQLQMLAPGRAHAALNRASLLASPRKEAMHMLALPPPGSAVREGDGVDGGGSGKGV
jgi:hypothetical protein